jgi:hypothetical protein
MVNCEVFGLPIYIQKIDHNAKTSWAPIDIHKSMGFLMAMVSLTLKYIINAFQNLFFEQTLEDLHYHIVAHNVVHDLSINKVYRCTIVHTKTPVVLGISKLNLHT